jgi:hypothetical protein
VPRQDAELYRWVLVSVRLSLFANKTSTLDAFSSDLLMPNLLSLLTASSLLNGANVRATSHDSLSPHVYLRSSWAWLKLKTTDNTTYKSQPVSVPLQHDGIWVARDTNLSSALSCLVIRHSPSKRVSMRDIYYNKSRSNWQYCWMIEYALRDRLRPGQYFTKFTFVAILIQHLLTGHTRSIRSRECICHYIV